MSRIRLGGAVPILLVTATALATWMLAGVALGEALRFLTFELFYVLFPGCLLYVLLSPSPGGWLRVLAIGWPCGYAIEVGAFAATAALGARELFTFLPLMAAAAGAPFLTGARGRARVDALRRDLRERSHSLWSGARRAEAMAVACTLSAALVLLALSAFASYPLPALARSVFYLPDSMDHISLAAEALHHWPITVPWVSGLREHYYIAVFVHFAAIGQVTGVPLSTVVLRLFPTMAIVVSALQLWALGRALDDSRWTAPVAVALLLIVADLNLDFTRLGGVEVEGFATSPSYGLGVIFFLGLLVLSQAWLTDTDTAAAPGRRAWAGSLPRGSLGLLVLLGVLVMGAAASKSSSMADFLGGLGLLWVWRVAHRESFRLLSYAVVVSAGSFLAVYLLLLRGGYSSGLQVHALDFVHYTVFGPTFTAGSGTTWPVFTGHSVVWLAGLLGAAAMSLLFTLVPVLGAGWLLVSPRAISTFTLLCVAIFIVALLAYVMLSFPGDSESAFLVYGTLALVPVAALGLVRLAKAMPREARGRVAPACAAVLVAGLAAGESSRVVGGSGRASWYVWYAVTYGFLTCLVVIAALGLQRNLAASTRSRVWRLLACGVVLVVPLGLVKPAMLAESRMWRTIFHEQISLADSRSHQGMTAALYDGLIWVRNHTKPCDVLAVNNHYTYAHSRYDSSAMALFSFYEYYSAFTERRILLESWYTTPRGVRDVSPYPARLALNDTAVVDGSPGALREIAGDGVSYVLIDKTHGGGAPEPASVSRLEFENSALRVYRLLTPPRGGRRCGTVTGI